MLLIKEKVNTLPIKFTIRVYGMLFNRQNEILVSHEQIKEISFTKFPGGGLEFGEGPKDCIVREMLEETGVDVEVISHIYTCEEYIQNQFDPTEQVIGIYYLVRAINNDDLKKINSEPKKHPFRGTENIIRHRWVHYKDLSDKILTFDLDRAALAELKKSGKIG